MATSTEMQITEGPTQGRVATLRLRGKLDAETSQLLMQRCAGIQANGQNLILNLSEVTFLGSTGVGALLALVEQFREQAGAVRLACLSQPTSTVIDVLDLGDYLPIHDTEEDALAAMEG
jgi:anti-sigma B factor antagonist